MRSVLSATLMVAASVLALSGRRAGADDAALHGGAKPKPVTTVPVRPALQKPEETAKALGQASGSSDAKACGSRDLRAEIGPALVPDAVQRVSGAPQSRDPHRRDRPRLCSASLRAALRPGHETLRQREPHACARQPAGDADRRAVGAPAGRARHPAIIVKLDRVHAARHRRHRLHLVSHRGQLARTLSGTAVRPRARCPRSRPAALRPPPAGSCRGRSD